MVNELKELLKNAYTPISHFNVSSVVETKDGRYFKGVNVEDASLRSGTCAERNAIYNAITNGVKKGEFKMIHVMVESGKISTPCFVCRQMINELFDKEDIVRSYSTNGDFIDYKVKDLCPYPFDQDDLN